MSDRPASGRCLLQGGIINKHFSGRRAEYFRIHFLVRGVFLEVGQRRSGLEAHEEDEVPDTAGTEVGRRGPGESLEGNVQRGIFFPPLEVKMPAFGRETDEAVALHGILQELTVAPRVWRPWFLAGLAT